MNLEGLPKQEIKENVQVKFTEHIKLSILLLMGTVVLLTLVCCAIYQFMKAYYPEKVTSCKNSIKAKICNGAIRSFLVASLTLSFYPLELLKSLSTMGEHVAEAASILTAI